MAVTRWLPAILAAVLGTGCLPNHPYPASEWDENIEYGSYSEPPKTLDPAISYSADEYALLGLIYEPPLGYHYLKRPYELIPLTAEHLPVARYVGRDGAALPPGAPSAEVARSIYDITIKPGIRYQPHPCFNPAAANEDVSRYDDLTAFRHTGTRELTADDYVTGIKRLADPTLNPNCPILPMMAGYIEGLGAYAQALRHDLDAQRAARRKAAGALYSAERDERDHPIVLDLDRHPLAGVRALDHRTFRLTIKGKYPQILYWLAMPFFAPIPREALAFYARPQLIRRNLTLERFPVGTGPYRLDLYQPNRLIVLVRNENFHGQAYPREGEPGDRARGLLADAGKPLPFIDRIVRVMEKESIPRWLKFQQGYYDASGVPSESFDQAVQFSPQGAIELTAQFKEQKMRMETEVQIASYYFAFNMLDDVFGGYSDAKRKLRQAVAIAVDTEERIQIFYNGLGFPAQGILPPGLFGHEDGPAGIDPSVYTWDARARAPRRRPLSDARRLLAEAGYPGGRDAKGRPLELKFTNAWNDPEHAPVIRWLTQKLDAIGIRLIADTTDYNRFQEKALQGNYQFLAWGWYADYPDPENFMFLLYGLNGKARHQGENVSNYDSPEYNRLFLQLQTMENGSERLALIRKANALLHRDAPLIWGFHPVTIGLYQGWVTNTKPHGVANDTLKYVRLDPAARAAARAARNGPALWPLAVLVLLGACAAAPLLRAATRRAAG